MDQYHQQIVLCMQGHHMWTVERVGDWMGGWEGGWLDRLKEGWRVRRMEAFNVCAKSYRQPWHWSSSRRPVGVQ